MRSDIVPSAMFPKLSDDPRDTKRAWRRNSKSLCQVFERRRWWARQDSNLHQTVTSGRTTIGFVEFAAFSFFFLGVCCPSIQSFLVRNWCGCGSPKPACRLDANNRSVPQVRLLARSLETFHVGCGYVP
jgi:hypothetical protein